MQILWRAICAQNYVTKSGGGQLLPYITIDSTDYVTGIGNVGHVVIYGYIIDSIGYVVFTIYGYMRKQLNHSHLLCHIILTQTARHTVKYS